MTDISFVAVGGENLIDYLKREEGDVAAPGGSPFNVAMGLGRQGADVTYLTPISTDKWGDMLAEKLLASHVKLGAARREEPTTMAIVEVTNGVPDYTFHRTGTAERAITLDAVQHAVPSGCQLLHIGSLALAADPDASVWVDLCAQAQSSGIVISLDPNVRLGIVEDKDAYRRRLIKMLQMADVIKMSDEDLEGLFPDLSFDDAMAHVVSQVRARLLIITRGQEDGYAFLNKDPSRFPVKPADPLVDTVGAGDTFMATLLASLSTGPDSVEHTLANLTSHGLERFLQRAATAAAINCQRTGCEPPTPQEIDAVLSDTL